MGGLEHFFWIVAVFSSIFAIIMLFFSLLGLSHEGDVDHDFHVDHDHGDGHDHGENNNDIWQLFTLKNMIMFFVGFSWTGIIGASGGWPNLVTGIASLLVGIIFATIFALVFRKISRLGESGNIENYDSALGKIGTVYLPIDPKRSNVGKVQITVSGRIREINAVTDDNERIPTNSQVKVIEVAGATLIVTNKLK